MNTMKQLFLGGAIGGGCLCLFGMANPGLALLMINLFYLLVALSID